LTADSEQTFRQCQKLAFLASLKADIQAQY